MQNPRSAASFEEELRQARIMGILRAQSAEIAVEAARAAIRAGLRVLEVAFTTPGATEALQELRGLPILLGAGTLLTRAEGEAALEAGARFLVSPHLGEDLLELSREAQVPYLPGVLTPTEVHRALRLGASLIKLFPIGAVGGAVYLQDLLGPFPGLKAMVTGGVRPSEVPRYLQAGALAVGLGSNLFPRQALAEDRWEAVEAAARAALDEAGGVV